MLSPAYFTPAEHNSFCVAGKIPQAAVCSAEKKKKGAFMSYLGAFQKRKLTAALRQQATGAATPHKTNSRTLTIGELWQSATSNLSCAGLAGATTSSPNTRIVLQGPGGFSHALIQWLNSLNNLISVELTNGIILTSPLTQQVKVLVRIVPQQNTKH